MNGPSLSRAVAARKVRSALLTVLHGIGAALFYRAFVNFRCGSPMRILSAHRVIDTAGVLSEADRADAARGSLTLREFAAAMRYLKKRYAFVALPEYVRCLKAGQAPPRNAVVLTFDDGFSDVVQNAVPLLIRERVPFTVFLTTGWVGSKPGIMTEKQIRSMSGKAGRLVTWGAHGVTHRSLTELKPDEMEEEIERSRRDVQSLVGAPIGLFCYPDGKHNDAVRASAERCGFVGACATGRALNIGKIDPFALKRIPFESESLARFAFRVAGRV